MGSRKNGDTRLLESMYVAVRVSSRHSKAVSEEEHLTRPKGERWETGEFIHSGHGGVGKTA
jgi:hypothetical protein